MCFHVELEGVKCIGWTGRVRKGIPNRWCSYTKAERTENEVSARDLQEVRRKRRPENMGWTVRNKKTREIRYVWPWKWERQAWICCEYDYLSDVKWHIANYTFTDSAFQSMTFSIQVPCGLASMHSALWQLIFWSNGSAFVPFGSPNMCSAYRYSGLLLSGCGINHVWKNKIYDMINYAHVFTKTISEWW